MTELDPKSIIFSAALVLFLLIGAAKLIIEELISLVILYKKLRATIRTPYSLNSAQPDEQALQRIEHRSD